MSAAAGHKLVGGGALDNWTGNGSLLFSSRPQSSPTRWEASGKDHFFADPTTITAFGMMLADSNNEYQVIVQEQTSAVSSNPLARATLPSGYVMTGGGCYANWQTTPPRLGNLLTGSYPDETTRNAWICTSTDHLEASPAVGKGNQFIVTRSENKQVSGGVKIDFTLEAFNLLASNPNTAVLRFSELGSEGNTVTVSPCGDRLMHFRWTQLNPTQGQANFYARKDYPSTQSVLADWDQVLVGGSAPTPTARAEMSGSSFIVRLTSARLRSNGLTTFPSRQCEAP